MSRGKAAILGSMSSQIFMVIIMLGGIVITPYLLRYLDKEEYGLMTVIFQFIGYLNLFDFGLGTAVSRTLAAHRGDDPEARIAVNKIISTSFITYSLIGLLIVILVLSFSPFVPSLFDTYSSLKDSAVALTLSLGLAVSIQFPLKALYAIFYAHQRQLLSNVVSFIVTFSNLVLPLVFLSLGFKLWSYVYTNIACSVINIIAIIILYRRYYKYIRIRIKNFDRSLLRDMFHFGFFLFLNSIAGQVIFFTDRFFIGSLVSLSAVTIYAVTAKAPEFSREMIFRITDNVFPALVEVNTKNGEEALKAIHQKLLTVITCVFTIAGWMIGILNIPFLRLWVGEGFYTGHSIFILTLVLMVQHTLQRVSGVCLMGAGVVKGFSLMSVAEAVINITLTLVLGRMFGVEGILWATIIAGILTGLWYIPYSAMKHLNISLFEYLKAFLAPFLSISFLGIPIFFIAHKVLPSIQLTWFNFFAISGAIGFLFAAFAWVFFLRREFAHYIPARIKRFFLVAH